MSVQTGDLVKMIFTTTSPATGAAADADSLPTGVLWVDGVADAATVTIADATGTGSYTFSVTMPTLTTGQRVQVRVDATIGGVACAGVVWEDQATPAVNVTLWKGDAPADLSVNGRVDATVGEMQSDVIMASAYDESTAWPLTDTEKLSLERLQSMIESVPFGELSYYRFRDSALDTVIGADGDTLETLSDQIDGVGEATGSGAISFPVTVNDEDSNPIDGVEVWISTDSAGASVVAGTLSTDALGLATFMLDAGTYYLWRQKSGYNFTNPVTIVVS